MTWFKVDDGLAFHHKVVEAGNSAMGLWVRAGAWCHQQNNDGKVPATMVRALGGQTAHAKALVRCGLWEEDGPFYLFHDWDLYQPTSAEVKAARLAKSEKRAEAGRAGGIASGVARRANSEAEPKQTGSKTEASDEPDAKQTEAPSPPLPSLPSQPSVVKPPKARLSSTPDVFPISEAMERWAREKHPLVTDLADQTERFLDYHRGKGSKQADWVATWRTWIRNARQFERAPLRAVPSGPQPLTVDQQRGRRM